MDRDAVGYSGIQELLVLKERKNICDDCKFENMEGNIDELSPK